MLDAGPAAWEWDEDQCWTLARIAELVRRRFKVDYTLAGLDLLLHRIGWSVQSHPDDHEAAVLTSRRHAAHRLEYCCLLDGHTLCRDVKRDRAGPRLPRPCP